MESGTGFLLEFVWSSLVVNPARAVFYSGNAALAAQLSSRMSVQPADARIEE
ncbi:hypothetical protein [Pseudarthrobacter sp. IC2-21]|jgi:hypothetical protein|uniref:hypothetical protein n=1 Tax=Pseudarthrobacter sp. IC2-21 TaxID=3092262 RepID=UPI002A69C294|nr:hypothetical protein [Pseudarthrobacter sp. IC2-21]